MSPAKRLSRQRFRALCERCAHFVYADPTHRRTMIRVARWMLLIDRGRGGYYAAVEVHARLAR